MGDPDPLPAATPSAPRPCHTGSDHHPSPRTLRHVALQVIDQPDPQTAGLNPTAIRLQLHLLLRNGGFGTANFPPDVCAAAFLSSATRAATSLSAAASHLQPFAAPYGTALAALRHIHSHFAALCPHPAVGFTDPAAAQLAQLPTLVRRALHEADHAELVRLLSAD
jgi:hypothetical protein